METFVTPSCEIIVGNEIVAFAKSRRWAETISQLLAQTEPVPEPPKALPPEGAEDVARRAISHLTYHGLSIGPWTIPGKPSEEIERIIQIYLSEEEIGEVLADMASRYVLLSLAQDFIFGGGDGIEIPDQPPPPRT